MPRAFIIGGLFLSVALGLLALPAQSAGRPGSPPTFGADVPVSAAPAYAVRMAANPTNPLNFIIAATVDLTLTTYATTDGGQTWHARTVPEEHPALTFDATGTAHLVTLTGNYACPDYAQAYKSTDGGLTWTTAGSPLLGVGWWLRSPVALAADTWPGSPYFGRVYSAGATRIGYVDCTPHETGIMVSYSRDTDILWSLPFLASDLSYEWTRFPSLVVAPSGTIYLGYQHHDERGQPGSDPYVHLLTRSTSGGVTWSPSTIITSQPISPTGVLYPDSQLLLADSPTTAFHHDDRPFIGAAPGNPAVVYALWTDGRWESTFTYSGQTGRHADLAFSRSTDSGQTWSTPRRVNDDPAGNGKDQFGPSLAVGNDGTLHATWLDRRDDPNGYAYRPYYSQSTDGGLTWLPNQPVGDVSAPPAAYTQFESDFDTALAVNGANSLVLPAWIDSRNGPRVYTDRGTLPPGGTATATRTATPGLVCSPQPRWQPAPTLTPNVWLAQGALAADGKFYVPGGAIEQGTPTSRVIRYNATNNAWENGVAMPVEVSGAAVAAAGNQIYVAGGHSAGGATNTLYIYNTASGAWTQGPPLPVSAGLEYAVAASLNGKIYIIGGRGDGAPTGQDTLYIYDPGTNAWSSGALLPGPQLAASATGMGDRIYVFGGYLSRERFLSYDPTTNTWTVLPPPPDLPPYIGGGGLSPYGPGNLLVTGVLQLVRLGNSGWMQAMNTSYIYDTATQTWRTGPTMRDARGWHTQGTLADGRVLVYGGVMNEFLPYPLSAPELLAPPVALFNDVPASHPFYLYIYCLVCRGIISGYSDGTFRPNLDVTRGQAAKIIAGAANLSGTPSGQTFADVPPSQPFYLWIERLAATGAISGYTCGGTGEPCDPQNRPYFRPGAVITRGQLAKVDAITAQVMDPIPATRQTFADVPPTNAFWLFIERLAGRAILSGYTCGGAGEPCDPQNRPYFRWGTHVTRGQTSKIVANTFFPNCTTSNER